MSFAYPGTSRLVLDDVSLTLPAGAVVAIVGENGAGKTTLVKLLAKMYEPTSGAILVDDTPLARMPADEWRARLAGAFQDFFRFEFRARQTRRPRRRAAPGRRAGRGRRRSTAPAPTMSSRGCRRASTRSSGRRGPAASRCRSASGRSWRWRAASCATRPLLLVLDEPTAALDAETEHALFERYAAAARGDGARDGRITILVSHRFSTVRMADLIVVLDGARLVEVGTHDELMAKGGQYAELYGIQAAAYR